MKRQLERHYSPCEIDAILEDFNKTLQEGLDLLGWAYDEKAQSLVDGKTGCKIKIRTQLSLGQIVAAMR